MNKRLDLPPALTVTQVLDSHLAQVGDDLTVRRALPGHAVRAIGPWVFLDHFGPAPVSAQTRGVPPHPHAGIQTVTYLLDGRMAHRDSAGHAGIVGPGGAQWMTAGRGIVHAEQPLPPEGATAGTLHGVQLWTSLPRAKKAMPPGYQAIDARDVAVQQQDGVQVRVVAGELGGTTGPAHTEMPLLLWHVTLEPQATFGGLLPAGHEAGVYVLEGDVTVGEGGAAVALGHVARLDAGQAPGAIMVHNPGDSRAQVLVLGGAPAEGPLVFHGPFVMNSVEQIRAAERAYMTGAMGLLSD
ncbi:MAG: pirin family protein [Betaproteobacteria bacterium]|nr:pirin family protein [Betaproteobacteria bacterium]